MMPSSAAMRAAVRGWSPVIMITLSPVWCASLFLAEGDAEVLAAVLDGPLPRSSFPLSRRSSSTRSPRDALGDPQAAESSVERALERAGPDGIIFPFVATPVRALLERHPRQRTAHAGGAHRHPGRARRLKLARAGRPTPELREDLSERELLVLRCLPSNLSAPEIGAELYL
jgi:LuxR family maltose regulon positive regulatory protein